LKKNHLQDLQQLWKTIFNILWTILAENLILKKKKKFPQICSAIAKNAFFWNFNCGFVAGNSMKSAKNRLEGPINPLFFPKNVLYFTTQNWRLHSKKTSPQKKPLFGGRGSKFSCPVNPQVTWAANAKLELLTIFYCQISIRN
jgi:hypothetical protein